MNEFDLSGLVNEICDCGGSGPDDPGCCPACKLYHRVREQEKAIAELAELLAKIRPVLVRPYCRCLHDHLEAEIDVALSLRQSPSTKPFDKLRASPERSRGDRQTERRR